MSYYESKAVDALLKERLTPKLLARKAQIPPGKVYSIISALLEKGLVEETDSRPKQLFIPDPAALIGTLIEGKQREQEHLFSELRHLASSAAISRSQPSRFFQIGTTLEDNRDIQLRSFLEAKHEVCQIINKHHRPSSNRSSKTVWERAIADAVKRGVTFRSLYPEDAELPVLLQQLPASKFQVRRLTTDFTRCDIIDRKSVLLKLVHADATAYGGILFIENEKLARNLQGIFEQLWLQSSP